MPENLQIWEIYREIHKQIITGNICGNLQVSKREYLQ